MLTYNVDQLGWVDFESLCQILLQTKLGLGIESWGGSGDWGRDAYFKGPLAYPGKRQTHGPFFFQCKFVSGANAAGANPKPALLKASKAEASRLRKRFNVKLGEKSVIAPRHYIFLSNAVVGGPTRTEIENVLADALPKETQVHIQDGRDICNWIDTSPEIVRRFPQLFTIRDLNELLRDAVQARVLTRSKTAILMAQDEARVFVPTSAYFQTWEKLREYNFAVLEGPPEMGKTMIGRMVMMAQLRLGWDAIECRHPKEFHDAYRPTTSQIFFADDFFGRTDYEPSRVGLWQDELPYILRRLDSRHWFILTSRAHLLKMGKADLDISNYNAKFPDLGEVLVNAARLTRFEKAQILYRHAKVAGLTEAVKAEIRAHLVKIVDHEHYTPLRIRKLVQSLQERAR